MLILVGVTISISLNGGLFKSTEIASRDTEKNAIYEIIISASQYDSNGDINVGETYNSAKQTLNSNGYREISDLSADGSFTVTGKNGKNKYNYKITKSKIEIVGLANDNDSKDDSSVTYALVKEEEQEGENVITAIYANQAQAYAVALNEWLYGSNTTEDIPSIPTEGVTEEEKSDSEELKQKAQAAQSAIKDYMENQTEENANKYLTAINEFNTVFGKYEKITISNNCEINASKENASFKSLGDYVELTGEVTIGKNITKVLAEAFQDNKTIKGVTFSDSVATIGEGAFRRCTELESVKISNSVTTIENSAFYWASIKEIEIPSSVTTIGDSTFGSNEKLTKIVLNNSVTGRYMFGGCTALEEVTIPKNITVMGGWEFSSCTNLKTINIENNMISNNEFFNIEIAEITIPGNVKIIGNFAFANCKLLKRVVIENGVEEIGYRVFGQETQLDSITIPTSVKKLDSFIEAPKEVYYEGTVEQWNAIESSDNTCFHDNNTKIHMSDGTTYIYDGNLQLVQNQ